MAENITPCSEAMIPMFVPLGERSENRFKLKTVLKNKTAGGRGRGSLGCRIIFVGKVAVCSRVELENEIQLQSSPLSVGAAVNRCRNAAAAVTQTPSMCGTHPQHMAATRSGPLPPADESRHASGCRAALGGVRLLSEGETAAVASQMDDNQQQSCATARRPPTMIIRRRDAAAKPDERVAPLGKNEHVASQWEARDRSCK